MSEKIGSKASKSIVGPVIGQHNIQNMNKNNLIIQSDEGS